MTTPVNFPIRLQDQVSGPARAVVSSLNSVAKAAEGVNKATGQSKGGKAGPKRSPEQVAWEKQIAAIKKQHATLAKAREQSAKADADGFGKVAAKLAVLGGAVAIAGKALGLAADFGEAVLSAQRFKEDSQLALETLMKSSSAAKSAIGSMRKIAGDLALDPRGAVGGLVELTGKGFNVAMIERITKSLADLRTVAPNSDPARIVRALGKVKSTGHLQGDEMDSIVEAGVDAGRIFAELSKIMNKPIDQLQKMKEAGKIGSAEAIEAILRAVNATTGGRAVGDVAAERARSTISGTIDMIKSRWESFILDIDIGAGDKSVFAFLRQLADLFDTTTGRGARLKKAVGGIFDAVGTALGDVFGKAGGSVFDVIVVSVETLAEVLRAALPGILEFFSAMFGRVIGIDTGLTGAAGSMKEWAKATFGNKDAMRALGQEVGTNVLGALKSISIAAQNFSTAMRALEPMLRIWGMAQQGLDSLALRVMSVINAITGLASNMRGSGESLGTALIDGLVGAIVGGGNRIIDAVKGAAGSAISGAKSVLGIASPSRVFEKIGVQTLEGFARGIGANDNGRSLLGNALEPPTGAQARGAGMSLAGAGAGGGMVVNIHINIEGGGKDPEAIGREVERRLVAFFERQAMAGGLKSTGT